MNSLALKCEKPNGRHPFSFSSHSSCRGTIMAEQILPEKAETSKPSGIQVFGRLTVIGNPFRKEVGSKGQRATYVECRCECGNIQVYNLQCLKRGTTRSCGCLRRERSSHCRITHGHAKSTHAACSLEYSTWTRITQRCNNLHNHKYKNYGGRGIKVCQRWQTFENFFADMGKKPSPQHSIDRIDVDGDYCPENCRWATQKEQQNNRRDNILLSAFGRTQTLSQWAEEVGIKTGTLQYRIARKWPIEKALLHPTR